MAELFESKRWSLAQPRRAPRSQNQGKALRPRETLDERGTRRELLGPYETRYDVAFGYSTGPEVLRP